MGKCTHYGAEKDGSVTVEEPQQDNIERGGRGFGFGRGRAGQGTGRGLDCFGGGFVREESFGRGEGFGQGRGRNRQGRGRGMRGFRQTM